MESMYFHRRISWGRHCYHFEAGITHAQRLIAEVGVTDGKGPPTPGTKSTGSCIGNAEGGAHQSCLYMSLVGTARYIAEDRYDLQVTVGLLSRERWARLQPMAFYLHDDPTLVQSFYYQNEPNRIYIESDSYWARCEVSRRSTSSETVHLGRHTVFSGSSLQQVVPLSIA